MSYIENTLLVREKVLFKANQHWIIFIPCLFWLVISLILSMMPHGINYIGFVSLFLAVYSGLKAMLRYLTSEYALTNKRVLVKLGFIRRNSFEIFLQKVEGIQVIQSILGRLFNFGTITICGTGGARDQFTVIADPLLFRRLVQQEIEKVLTRPEIVEDIAIETI